MDDFASIVSAMCAGDRVCIPLSWPNERRADLMHAQASADARDSAVMKVASNVMLSNRGEDPAASILRRVQNLPNVQPRLPDGHDCYQGSVRTLLDGGNCSCKTILAMALATCCGIRTLVAWYVLPGASSNHVAPAFRVGGLWRIGETLLVGARLGEDPFAAQERLEHHGSVAADRSDGVRSWLDPVRRS